MKFTAIVTTMMLIFSAMGGSSVDVTTVYAQGYSIICKNQFSFNTISQRMQFETVPPRSEMIKESIPSVDKPALAKVKIEDCYYIEQIPLDKKTQKAIYDICNSSGVEYELLLGILDVESDFNKNVKHVNKNGSTDSGIAQINSYYIDHYAEMAQIPIDEFDPNIVEHGIRALCGKINYLTDNYKELGYSASELTIHVLNAYNMGESGYKKYKKRTGSISRSYDKKTLRARNEYIAITQNSAAE